MKNAELYGNLLVILRPRVDKSGQPTGVSKPIILICDDEPDLRMLIATYAKEIVPGCVIIEACDGEEGVAKCRELQPHVVLTDLHMPKLNGTQMTKEIRRFDKKTHIILMSGFADRDAVVDFLRLGASDVVDKPVEFDRLSAALTSALPETIKGEVRYKVPQFVEIMSSFMAREEAEQQNPHELVKVYNSNMPNVLATVGILMPNGEVVEVKRDKRT